MNLLKLLLPVSILFSTSCKEKYNKLSEENSGIEELLKKINVESNIKYWQLEHFPNYSDESKNSDVLFAKGECTTKEKEIIPNNELDWNGFFPGCLPAFCAYRIMYIENNTWKGVKSEEALKSFIGKIDNEYEAFLIGEINGYTIDIDSEMGNGFKILENGFKIKMMKYNSCPKSKESFTFIVTKNGKIEDLKSEGYYLKSKDCIVY